MDLPSSPSFLDDWEVVASDLDGSAVGVDETADGPWPPRVWWASLLMKHARTLGLVIPAVDRPVTCVSACTGSFAEGFVLEAGSNSWASCWGLSAAALQQKENASRSET